MKTGLDKKSFWYLGAVLIIAVLVVVGFFYYYSFSPPLETETINEEVSEELERQQMIEEQKGELEDLRKNTEPLTEEEIEKQKEELDRLR